MFGSGQAKKDFGPPPSEVGDEWRRPSFLLTKPNELNSKVPDNASGWPPLLLSGAFFSLPDPWPGLGNGDGLAFV